MDQHSSPQSETLQTIGMLEFRVSRPGVPIRRLRLSGNRYSFGSAPSASVRLDDRSLQPIHAVLQREVSGDAERIMLRSQGLPLTVNGRLTNEATLHTGDSFHLGEYQFELVGSIEEPLPAAPAESAGRPSRRAERQGGRSGEETRLRRDHQAPRRAPRLSFAAGMRLVDEQESASEAELPLRPERTLDAIERALMSESRRAEAVKKEAELRQEVEQTLREESRKALQQQQEELSEAHRHEMEKVLRRFAETQEQAAAANRAIESMQQQVADLGKQLGDATASTWQRQNELTQARRDRDQATDELRQATAASQQLISELDAVRRERSEISSSLHDVTVQLYTAKAEGDKGQSRTRELARQREEALQKVESFSVRCEELTAQLRQAEQTCQSVSNQRDEIAEQLRQRTAERDSAVALADQRGEELTAQESVIDGLHEQVNELERAVAESCREAEKLRSECQAACASVAKLEAIVQQGEQQRQADRDSWEAESTELRRSIEQISLELASASSELVQRNETADALQEELTATRNALAQAEQEVVSRPSSEELQAIRQRLEATENQLRELQSEADAWDSTVTSPHQEAGSETAGEGSVASSLVDDPDTAAESTVAAPASHNAADPWSQRDSQPDAAWESSRSEAKDAATDNDESPISGWPTYDTPDMTVREPAEETEPSSVTEPTEKGWDGPEADTVEEPSAWQAESNASAWGAGLANPWDIDTSDASPSLESSPVAASSDWQSSVEQPRTEDHSETGVFASQLLQQLAEEQSEQSGDAIEEAHDNATVDDDPARSATHGESGAAIADEDPDDYSGYDNIWDTAARFDPLSEATPEEAGAEDEIEPARQHGGIEQLREYLDYEETTAESETPATVQDESGRYQGMDANQAETPLDGTGSMASGTAAGEGGNVAADGPVPQAPQAVADEDDDSIEAYMNRLLQRVQGGDSRSYSMPSASGADDRLEDKPSTAANEPAAARSLPETQPPIDENSPFVPRSQAPERSQNLAAMRELANTSARTAIMSSVRKQTQNSVLHKFAQATGSALGASLMLYYSQMHFGWQMIAAICLTLLAAYWVIESLQLQVRLRAETEDEAAGNPDPEATGAETATAAASESSSSPALASQAQPPTH